MKSVREIIKLHVSMKLSVRKIQGATSIARSTVSDYIKRFKASGLCIEQIDAMDDDELQFRLFGDKPNTTTSRKALPDMNYIHQELKQKKKTKVTLYLLWEEYKEANPDGYQYTQFRVLICQHFIGHISNS